MRLNLNTSDRQRSQNYQQKDPKTCQVVENPALWLFFDIPRSAISRYLPGFTHRWQSSCPRKFRAGSQPPNPAKDLTTKNTLGIAIIVFAALPSYHRPEQ